MLINTPIAAVKDFVDLLNDSLSELKPNARLTKIQVKWISFCLMGILMFSGINWAKLERHSLGKYKAASLSWVFRHAKISWEFLLIASVKVILKQHNITEGTLVLDEVDRSRTKQTTCIHRAHKLKDKATSGYVNGQCIVLLLLVTDTVTFPVGFSFYQPDPKITAWEKEDRRLKKQGLRKKERSPKPERNPDYPTKIEIALTLLQHFEHLYTEVKIKAILADALYGNAKFMDKASAIFKGVQVISQLRSNQNIKWRGKTKNIQTYFNQINKGVPQLFSIRGGKLCKGIVSSARLYVKSHGTKRFVIALKYEGEKEYRYLVATDMTWRTCDIIQAYTLRWLVEVFFEDWKLYEGWGLEAKQQGEEGSSRGLILSLLFDHCFLLHPEQKACIENKRPMYTVGSLQRKLQIEALLETITDLFLTGVDISERLKAIADKVNDVFQLMPSGKHMIGRDLGQLEPATSLLYRENG